MYASGGGLGLRGGFAAIGVHPLFYDYFKLTSYASSNNSKVL